MSTTTILQLIASFIIGGGLVGVLSLIAERSCREVAGIILSLPSTMAVGLFFMGWVLGPETIMTALPAMPLSLGASFIFPCAYIAVVSRLTRFSYGMSALCGVFGGVVVWFAIAYPVSQFSNLSLGASLIGYGVLIGIAHYLLAIRPKEKTKPITMHFTTLQILSRSVVAGTLIGSIILISKLFGPVWGGMFSVFPAAMLSTMLIVHRAHGASFVLHVLRSMPLSSVNFIVYMIIAAYSFPVVGMWWGTVVSYGGAAGCLFALYRFRNRI